MPLQNVLRWSRIGSAGFQKIPQLHLDQLARLLYSLKDRPTYLYYFSGQVADPEANGDRYSYLMNDTTRSVQSSTLVCKMRKDLRL
jgi:hypothetical protein